MEPASEPNLTRKLPIRTVLITLVVSVGVAALTAQIISSRSISASTSTVYGDGYAELVERIERLERRHANEGDTAGSKSSERHRSEPESSGDNQDIRDVSERIARLEELEQARQESERQAAERTRFIQEQRSSYFAQRTEIGPQVMLDPAANDETKAIAWRNMRMNAAGVWNDQIVSEAVRIGTTSPDPQVRADIWRQAHADHTHPLLLQPLLQALATDPHQSVREEAAETLDMRRFFVRSSRQRTRPLLSFRSLCTRFA